MKTLFTTGTLYLLVLLIFSVFSCEEDETTPQPIGSLTARAGTDQNVQIGQTVNLDGSASTDSQHKAFTYQWELIKKPEGSSASLTGHSSSKPSFVPDAAGRYEVELTIANENGHSRDKVHITAAGAAVSQSLPEYITAATVLEDIIADPNVPDYVAEKSVVVTAELTIKPGVVIALARDTRFDINSDGGAIIARGEAGRKIRFTGKESTKGYWRGMVVYSTSSANVLDHVEIAYAGSHFTLNNIKAALTLFGTGKARLSVHNTSFIHNNGYGFHAADGSVLKAFSNNTFSENAEAGILLAADNVNQLDAASVFSSNNGRNVVEISASGISSANGEEIIWGGFTDKTPYRTLGELRIGTGLKLLAGVSLEVGNDQQILIEEGGYLNAQGTATDKIKITGTIPTPGYWRGIAFYSTSNLNVLSHVHIGQGGSYPLVSGKKANIALIGSGAKLTIKDSGVSGSGGYGIYVRSGAIINADARTSNIFEGNLLDNVYSEDESTEGAVPEKVLGKWMMGYFSMSEFWKYDGSFVGNAFELAVAFDFKKDGTLEFYFVSGGSSEGCRTEAFVYKKGKVAFDQNGSFTFTPTEGSAKGFYKGCTSNYKDYNRQYENSELLPETYFYELSKDSNGNEQLVIRFRQNDQNSSWFQRSNW